MAPPHRQHSRHPGEAQRVAPETADPAGRRRCRGTRLASEKGGTEAVVDREETQQLRQALPLVGEELLVDPNEDSLAREAVEPGGEEAVVMGEVEKVRAGGDLGLESGGTALAAAQVAIERDQHVERLAQDRHDLEVGEAALEAGGAIGVGHVEGPDVTQPGLRGRAPRSDACSPRWGRCA